MLLKALLAVNVSIYYRNLSANHQPIISQLTLNKGVKVLSGLKDLTGLPRRVCRKRERRRDRGVVDHGGVGDGDRVTVCVYNGPLDPPDPPVELMGLIFWCQDRKA